MWTFGSDVIGDAAVMTGGQASFVRMPLNFFCRNMVSILTNNIALTIYMSPMRRDIFG
jgi:tRNA A37 threonylcarbamoyladenosine synthetase subunit TsaC/SUA5/YrdC